MAVRKGHWWLFKQTTSREGYNILMRNSPRIQKITEKIYPFLGLALIISVVANIYLLSSKSPAQDTVFSFERQQAPINLPVVQSTNCAFNAEMNVTYKDGKVEYVNNKNDSTINISFVDLDTKNPIMRGNAGQDDLLKVVDNDEVVTMIETSPLAVGTLQSFTIFKATGVGIWSKQYNLGSVLPYGMISMGYCD